MAEPTSDLVDIAPTHDQITDYDRVHLATYVRLLDAVAASAPWEEVARVVLNVDAAREPERARRRYETHMARAQWLTSYGYRDLLRGGRP